MYGNCIFLAQCHNIHSGSLLQFTSCITTIISAISIVESDNNLQKWGQDKIFTEIYKFCWNKYMNQFVDTNKI